MARKRVQKRIRRAPTVQPKPNTRQGIQRLFRDMAIILDVRGPRLPDPIEEKTRQHAEFCREAAVMQASGAPYSAIAARQGCAVSTAHGRVNAWYRLVRQHEDFELVRTKVSSRLDWIFEQTAKAYKAIDDNPAVPINSRTRLICEVIDRMVATTELHARIQGLLVEQNTVNIGPAAGAQMSQLNVKLPDDPDKRDRLLEHCRAVEGIVQGVCEE